MRNNHVLPARESASAPLQSQSISRHRVLVADDDVSIRMINIEMLVHSGYDVDAAEDGVTAWQALSSNNYNLLITDQNMPRLTGFELLKKLRDSGMDLPVILITGTLPKVEFTRYPWPQPEATLLKPYTFEELLGTVKEVLHESHDACQQIEPPPDRQIHLSAERWHL
jgi:DNA-binding response OmpR family regulator